MSFTLSLFGSRRCKNITGAAMALSMVFAAFVAPASAKPQDPVAAFYAGRTVSLLIGASVGGFLDVPTRLLATFFGKHIPGRPAVITQNMPGAASQILARYIYSQAERDGAVLGVTFPSVPLDAILQAPAKRVFDPDKLKFIGSSQSYEPTCLVRDDAPVQSPQKLLSTELLTGVTASGSMTYDFPLVANALVGTKFHLVKGYVGGADLLLALQRGEIQATCVAWSTIRFNAPTILAGKLGFHVLLQGSFEGSSELNRAGVPTLASLTTQEADKRALEFFLSQNRYADPLIAPPGIPADRLVALRSAFMDTMQDQDFIQAAAKAKMDLDPTSGADVQALVSKAVHSSPDVIARVKTILSK